MSRGRTLKHRDAAGIWLKAYLSGGPRPAVEVQRVSAQQGFGWMTVKRAKKALGFVSQQRRDTWSWSDPSVLPVAKPEPKLQDVLAEITQAVHKAQQAVPQPGDDEPEDDTGETNDITIFTYKWFIAEAQQLRFTKSDQEIEKIFLEILSGPQNPRQPKLDREYVIGIAHGKHVTPPKPKPVSEHVDFS